MKNGFFKILENSFAIFLFLTLFSVASQFLEDNPESVLDASFLESLNQMACKLVQVCCHYYRVLSSLVQGVK